MKKAHEIEYTIHGNDMQFVEIILDPQESVFAEAGGMMMMEDGIVMETKLGGGSNNGMLGKFMSAAKRTMTGESLFITEYTNHGTAKKAVSFSSSYPGKIIPVNLAELGGKSFVKKMPFFVLPKGLILVLSFRKN